jgi:5-carboxyvanillate decarboxylase
MKRIAVEEHFITDSLLNHLRSRKEWPKLEAALDDKKNKVERMYWSPDHFYVHNDFEMLRRIHDIGEARLKEMDENGITMQVLSISIPGVEMLDPSSGTEIAKNINDEVSRVVQKYPSRFSAFAAIAPQDPASAANELERAVNELGFKGAVVNSHIRGEYLDDPKFGVIFEKAEKLGVPLYLHPKQPSPDMIKPYLTYPALANAMWGFAAEVSLHAVRLMCSGVFDRYPGATVIIGHLGEAIPFWLWRLDNHWEKEGRRSLPAKKSPGHYFRNNFFVTTSGMFWSQALQFVSGVLGVEKILFAVDYPFESMSEAVQFMDRAPISEGEREMIYHSNAEKLMAL